MATTITAYNGSVFYLEGDGKSFIGANDGRKESLLSPLPLYGKDSNETDVFDFGGTIKTITLSGVYIANDTTDAASWIALLESFVQGDQAQPYAFSDLYRGNLLVKFADISTGKEGGNPLMVRWQVKLIESSTV